MDRIIMVQPKLTKRIRYPDCRKCGEEKFPEHKCASNDNYATIKEDKQ